MKQYIELGNDILENGKYKLDRTKVGTIGVFGRQTRFDLEKGFPLLTTKKVFLRGLIEELLWFLDGKTNNNDLLKKDVHIWDTWAVKDQVPMTFVELIASLQQAIPSFFEDTIVVFKVDAEGNVTNEKVQHDQIEIGSVAYNEILLLIKSTGELHNKVIPTTKSRPDGNDGALGPIYGHQWRHWIGHDGIEIDQIKKVIDDLNIRPASRRIIVTAWNPTDMPDESKTPEQNVVEGKAALASCHCLFQFFTEELTTNERWGWIKKTNFLKKVRLPSFMPDGIENTVDSVILENVIKWMNENNIPKYRLSCQLYQRSCDFALGVPFNIASYALLTMMVAQCVNMVPGEFVHTFGDLHVYVNHVDKLKEQLVREPRQLPTMWINPEKKDIFSFTIDDFHLEGYDPHPAIQYEIAK